MNTKLLARLTERNEEQYMLLDYNDKLLKTRSDENVTVIQGTSMTKQADAFDADINNIIKRFTPEMAHAYFAMRPGQYLDLTGVEDYHSALEVVRSAQADFDALAPEVRAAFNNDPAELLAAVYDPEREEELRELGIFEPEETPPNTSEAAAGSQAPPAPPTPAAAPEKKP